MDVQRDETLSEVDKQSVDANAEKIFTWKQIADRAIPKLFFIVLTWHIGLIASLAFYTFGFNSVPLKWLTILWGLVVASGSMIGITAGAHRLWTHRTYKANLALRILLMTLYSSLGITSITVEKHLFLQFSKYPLYYWIRDHRVHHKYSDTDADPHNANRGFFFSHMGWAFMKRHPECLRRGKEVNMSDIERDQIVMFNKKHAGKFRLIFCYIIPAAVPVLLWNETILHAILTQWFIRHVMVLNFTCAVNSVAHLWGNRPYNRLINPAENKLVSLVTLGEGSHNYHHTFPLDYKTSEYPYLNFNGTTMFIDTMAMLGWAYDLRQPSSEVVDKVIRRIGHKFEAH